MKNKYILNDNLPYITKNIFSELLNITYIIEDYFGIKEETFYGRRLIGFEVVNFKSREEMELRMKEIVEEHKRREIIIKDKIIRRKRKITNTNNKPTFKVEL